MVKNRMKFLHVASSLLILSGLTACDDHFFENEGDCEVTHAIRFVYNMNLKWADAFPSEVNSVNLYVFDESGVFIKEYTGKGQPLSDPSYRIMLDLPANKTYQFLVWCGLDNGETEECFTVPQPVVGETRIEEMSCTLNASATPPVRSGETEYSDRQLNFLYHGYLKQNLPDNHDGTHYEYTVYLTKDTNHIRVMLQQVTGSIDAEDFEFSLSADNGSMAWNNDLIGDTTIEYLPWSQESDVLGIANNSGEVSEYYGVIADLSTCRLMADDADKIFLTVKRTDNGQMLFKVPMIQYSLTELKYYEQAYGHKLTPQEFLDRQDEYSMTFFLDENLQWIYAVIEILEWRVVIRNYDINS